MYIYGSFLSQQGDVVTVHIVTNADRTQTLEIGTEKSGIFFTDDPAEITNEVNDTFDVLLRQSATISLQCRNLIGDFFCKSCRDAVVNIYKNQKCVFAGFIEPQSYSQPYNDIYDEVQLNCIDVLSALQYSKYMNVGALGVLYAAIKQEAQQRSFYDIVTEILKAVTADIDIVGGNTINYWYDGSKAIDAQTANRYQVFKQLSISDLLFLGDEEDDVWQQDEVLEEVLKYLNLHIVQDGFSFYIFSWESVRGGEDIIWHDIITNDTKTIAQNSVTIALDNVADCDTTISIDATYNQLLLTDDVTEVENIVESPLDSDSLTAQGNYQKFMTEYISYGEGWNAHDGMRDMATQGDTTYDAAKQVDWFCWPKSAANWKFYGMGNHTDMYRQYPADGTHQQDLLNLGLTAGVGACVCAFGKIEKGGTSDNAVVTSVSMTDQLIIALNGQDGAKPTEQDLLGACPVAEYTGNVAGGTFSPADEQTTNYVVISGKMALSPTMPVTASYKRLSDRESWNHKGSQYDAPYFHHTVQDRKGGVMYYCRKYWKADAWNDEPTPDDDANALTMGTFYPMSDEAPQSYEYNYSAVGQEKDTISKLGLLACMLIIGDKCVVEKPKGETLGTDKPGTGEGEPDDYVWRTYKERSQCQSDDEYYQQCFTIGVNPKLKDKIVGTEFDIQKNAPYTTGITAEGTAIPIRMGDRVSGQVRFLILGPVMAEWNQITRRHPSFWRHTKWTQESVALLTKANSIVVKDFKVEVVSDNGKIGAVSDDKDIVYMSDTKETFVNKKDDLSMKITTALTSKECKELGVNNSVKLSSPENTATKTPLLAIYDQATHTTAKPEQLYVDAYWQEWHEPRVLMEQTLMDTEQNVSLFAIYRHRALGKRLHVQGISRNMGSATATLTLKEVF